MLTDWELWAAAHRMLEEHGSDASAFVASRIGALALEGEAAGVAAWKEIARRMVELGAVPPPDSRS
jgi:hypothetical protein